MSVNKQSEINTGTETIMTRKLNIYSMKNQTINTILKSQELKHTVNYGNNYCNCQQVRISFQECRLYETDKTCFMKKINLT